MLVLGWSHADEEPDDLGAPFEAGLALERGEWPGARSRGDRDVARSKRRGFRLWCRGRPAPAGVASATVIASSQDYHAIQVDCEPNNPKVEEWPAAVDPGNEPAEHADWLGQVIDHAGADHRIGLTPFSPALELQRWLDAHRHVAERCVVVFAHVYGEAEQMWRDLQPVLELARAVGKRVWIVECGPRSGQTGDEWAPHLTPFLNRCALEAPEVDAVCIFAPYWSRPDPGFEPLRLAGSEVERLMRAWRPPAVEQPKEDPVPEIPFDVDEMREIARTAAEVHGEDPDLVEAVTNQESGFNPRAGSRVGAKGLMQLMDETAAALGVTDSFDPVQNADAGVRYLGEKLDVYGGDVVRALVGYNGGHGAVQAWEAGSPIRESIDYVSGILGLELLAIRPDPCVVQFGQDLRSVLRADELGWIKSACGPIALSGLLERLGRPVPVEEILRWAHEFRHPDGRRCWDQDEGMQGLDVYEAFETMAAAFKVQLHRLERTGVLAAMTADRHGGVVISSRRHIFYAIRASTNDADLYVGNTGNALLNGAPWLSLDWIDANCGGLHALWWGELQADAPPVEPPAPPPVDAIDDASNNVWDALSKYAQHDHGRAIEAQRAFGDVLKPAIARGRTV